MKNYVKIIIKWLIHRTRLESTADAKAIHRQSLRGVLEHSKSMGFSPGTVIDVGAANGTFELYETFPDARHLLIDPLEENSSCLETIVKSLLNAEYIIAAATHKNGSVNINVHPDLHGSSLYLECEDSDVNGVPRSVPAITLDDLYEERCLKGPFLIKIDVQGAELDVLRGAVNLLEFTDYIILETSLFGFFVGGPQFSDIVEFMKIYGFVVYDFLCCQYRPLDGAMSQVDLVFVKENGLFRKYHYYATKEQRAVHNKMFATVRE